MGQLWKFVSNTMKGKMSENVIFLANYCPKM